LALAAVEQFMADLVERLVPDELWVLFRRVVPPTEVMLPQGGGRRRAGDREALAAIIFAATSGCPAADGRPNSTRTKAMTTTTCAAGSARAASGAASPARASILEATWPSLLGRREDRVRGWLAAADSTAATSGRRNTSPPSPA
jgi:hypothetical protein